MIVHLATKLAMHKRINDSVSHDKPILSILISSLLAWIWEIVEIHLILIGVLKIEIFSEEVFDFPDWGD